MKWAIRLCDLNSYINTIKSAKVQNSSLLIEKNPQNLEMHQKAVNEKLDDIPGKGKSRPISIWKQINAPGCN